MIGTLFLFKTDQPTNIVVKKRVFYFLFFYTKYVELHYDTMYCI